MRRRGVSERFCGFTKKWRERRGGKEDECGGEKNAGGVEKLFESEEFVENFTYEGDDLGVSVKRMNSL